MEATPKAITKAAALCTSCPKLCRFSCPVAVADGRESSTPTAKMIAASLLARGTGSPNGEDAEPLYRCTGCGLQETFCKHGTDAAGTLEAARGLAYGRGLIPARLREVEPRFRTDRAPLRDDLAQRAASFGKPAGRPVAMLLAGCRMLRDDPAGVETHRLTLGWALGGPVAIRDRVPVCCGYPLLALGDRQALLPQAQAFAKSAKDTGQLVASDPSCTFMLRKVYPELGVKLRPEVTSLPEALARAEGRINPTSPVHERVVYHDPCHLGRRLSVYDAPRQLIRRAGAELLTPPWDKDQARCSGFGGGYPLLYPAEARRIAAVRRAELAATGAERIVTACPSCRIALSAPDGPSVVDVTDLMAQALGISVPPRR